MHSDQKRPMLHTLTIVSIIVSLISLAGCTGLSQTDLEATIQAALIATQSAQPTVTYTSTRVPTNTPTSTTTLTPIATHTSTPVLTDTVTPIATPTRTPHPTSTPAPTSTHTITPVPPSPTSLVPTATTTPTVSAPIAKGKAGIIVGAWIGPSRFTIANQEYDLVYQEEKLIELPPGTYGCSLTYTVEGRGFNPVTETWILPGIYAADFNITLVENQVCNLPLSFEAIEGTHHGISPLLNCVAYYQ